MCLSLGDVDGRSELMTFIISSMDGRVERLAPHLTLLQKMSDEHNRSLNFKWPIVAFLIHCAHAFNIGRNEIKYEYCVLLFIMHNTIWNVSAFCQKLERYSSEVALIKFEQT